MNRRDLLRLSAASGAAALLPSGSLAAASAKPLRVAHLTDVHVLPTETAKSGFARAFARAYAEKPDLILIGGDCVMDAAATPTAEAEKQWAEWRAVRRDFQRVPVLPVLGNHDFHWKATAPADPLPRRIEGAKWAMDELGMKERFSASDRGGWRFLMLDSTFWNEEGYHAELDGPQMEWLRAELRRDPNKPMLISSHISIFSACGYIEKTALVNNTWSIPTSWMHRDAIALKDLFKARGNVKLCLSGHMHQRDEVVLNDTRYICAGAVSGNWWKGRYYDTDPGFLIADLYPDGRSETKYVLYDGPQNA